MKNIFHPLLVLLAKLTDPVVARQLKHQARELQFAKAENEQLRGRLPERVILTPQERRRLIRLGNPWGAPSRTSSLSCRQPPFSAGSGRRKPARSRVGQGGAGDSTSAR